MSAEIPYFVKVRGCINCDASTRLKEKTGHDYGFDHELVSRCVVLSCKRLGYDLAHPFIDPVEIFRMVEQIGTPGARLRGRELLWKDSRVF
ncbi:MAG: hypothetical protein UW69_C0029G0015 [Microgenomates group bacterium GW2011_GWA2_44_7]|nr:MAG: hypothetical protein UW69_C0029G0015 [Microgenomates group bacterium GW2011_GWA2_44_7]